MLKLSELRAQPWLWTMGGVTRWMAPLSLSTFAKAEANGCGLDELLSPDQERKVQAWIAFYAIVQDRLPDDALVAEVQAAGEQFAQFVQYVQATFDDGDDGEVETPVAYNHRKTKDPRELLGMKLGDTLKPETESGPETDFSMLFDVSRISRIPIADVYAMTFKGLGALARHLKQNAKSMVNPLTGAVD